MPALIEHAHAKVNLTLEVLGRRADGYHEIASLVAFADLHDILTLDPGRTPSVTATGPFADALGGKNLLATTFELLREAEPRLRFAAAHLDKRIPIAAGLGGGSADAAALLRGIRKHNPDLADGVDWYGLAARIGADVPACLENCAAWMTGAGERIAPLTAPLPPLHAILVNPLAQVPADKTAQVFRRYDARPVPRRLTETAAGAPEFRSRGEVLAFLRDHGNDLEAAAETVVPEIADVIAALTALPVEIARLSGAGPTCFGILADQNEASAAAARLRGAHPGWWVEAVVLG